MKDGKQALCPFYETWRGVIRRCCSDSFKNKNPTYKDCTVCEEWKFFSNFKAWMEKQDWQGKQLDKDLLVYGNKIYGPEFCCFVDREVNTFFTCEKNTKNGPIGCHFRNGKYIVSVGGKNRKNLGTFENSETALSTWVMAKSSLAEDLELKYPELKGILTKRVLEISEKELKYLKGGQL